MAFKQKIPVLAGAAVLVGGIFALVFLARPPAEDRLRAAVQKYAQTLGPVREVEIHGTLADIVLAPDGRCIFAEFAERGGEWVFVRDVGRAFVDMMGTPEKEREALNRLAQRLADRFRLDHVALKERLRVEMQVTRDEYGLAGQYLIGFAFPKSGDQPPQTGRYIETYRYKDGAWTVEGLGRLIVSLPGRRGEAP